MSDSVMLVVLVVVIAGPLIVLGVELTSALRSSRRLPGTDTLPEVTTTGRLLWKGVIASRGGRFGRILRYPTFYGLSRLELHTWGMRVGPTNKLGWGQPTWELRYGEIESVKLIRTSVVRDVGLKFQTGVLPYPVVFYTEAARSLLGSLRQLGVRVVEAQPR